MPPVIFIHGMFLTGKSWCDWIPFFEERGYACSAPSWPLHEGEPAWLREHIPGEAGLLALETVIDFYARLIIARRVSPILIGHSVGGLIVQRLIAGGLGRAGVCISSVAPNKMLSFDWDFFRNSAVITNPLKGNRPFNMTPGWFHKNFANTLAREDSDRAYDEFVVPESRNILRDGLGRAGRINLEAPHAPLLFVGGDDDVIIPAALGEKNAFAYADPASVTDFTRFAGRGHFLCGQPGWQEIAGHVAGWLGEHADASERAA